MVSEAFDVGGNCNEHTAWRQPSAGLALALERNYSLRMHTVLTKQTPHTLPHMVELSRKYDTLLNYGYTDAIALTLPISNLFVPTGEEVIAFLKDYLAAKLSGVKISSPASVIRRCIKFMVEWPIEDHTIFNEDNRLHRQLKIPQCGLKLSNLYIDSDGQAYPCLPLWGKKDAPNVYEVGVEAAWKHYDKPDCHQCKSVFTIEKGLFYSASIAHLLEYIEGFEFLRRQRAA